MGKWWNEFWHKILTFCWTWENLCELKKMFPQYKSWEVVLQKTGSTLIFPKEVNFAVKFLFDGVSTFLAVTDEGLYQFIKKRLDHIQTAEVKCIICVKSLSYGAARVFIFLPPKGEKNFNGMVQEIGNGLY